MYIKVRVTAGVKGEVFEQVSEDHFTAKVREKAEQNRANKRVIELVARHFLVPVGKVRIVNGHQSPSKLMVVDREE